MCICFFLFASIHINDSIYEVLNDTCRRGLDIYRNNSRDTKVVVNAPIPVHDSLGIRFMIELDINANYVLYFI